jgi:hypothetical protein
VCHLVGVVDDRKSLVDPVAVHPTAGNIMNAMATIFSDPNFRTFIAIMREFSLFRYEGSHSFSRFVVEV